MSTPSDATLRSRSNMWPAVVLLGLSVLINYIDRGNVAVASPQLKEELHLSASQLGLLFAAFYWTYTALQFASGWLVEQLDANVVIAAGFLIWSTATAATGLVRGIALLFAMRLLLGVGEAVAFPCYSKILAQHVPEEYRGLANGIIIFGTHGGPAVGTFAAGMLMARYGWRPVFIGIGLLSLLWLPLWARWAPRGPGLPRASALPSPGTWQILRRRSFWGASLGHFSGNYLFYFLITWMPLYLVRERHLSLEGMAKTAGMLYMFDAVASLATGWVADMYLRQGHSLSVVRKSAMGTGCVLAAIGLAGVLMSTASYLPWLVVAAVGCGIEGSGTFAFSQTLAGASAAGLWTGLQNGIANLSGAVGLALTGFLVDARGNFAAAFGVTTAIILIGGFAWVFIVGAVEPIAWTKESAPTGEAVIDVA